MPRKLYLPILAFAVEFVFSKGPFPEWSVYPLEYGLLFWFVIINIKNRGSWPYFVGIGTFLNFLVISLNGFRMPVWTPTLAKYGGLGTIDKIISGNYFGYTLVEPSTRLPFLADVIGISFNNKLMGFASLGDVFLLLGAILLFSKVLGPED